MLHLGFTAHTPTPEEKSTVPDLYAALYMLNWPLPHLFLFSHDPIYVYLPNCNFRAVCVR